MTFRHDILNHMQLNCKINGLIPEVPPVNAYFVILAVAYAGIFSRGGGVLTLPCMAMINAAPGLKKPRGWILASLFFRPQNFGVSFPDMD